MIGRPTHKTEVDYQEAGLGKTELVTGFTFVPKNDEGVRPGYYRHDDLVRLLRSAATNPRRVRFIADMME